MKKRPTFLPGVWSFARLPHCNSLTIFLFLVFVLLFVFLDDFALNIGRNLLVFSEFHAVGSTTGGDGTQRGGVLVHLGQRDLGMDHLESTFAVHTHHDTAASHGPH